MGGRGGSLLLFIKDDYHKVSVMWPFKTEKSELNERVMKLEAEMGIMRTEYKIAYENIMACAKRVEERYRKEDSRKTQAQEAEEIQGLLGGIDIAAVMKDPEALKAALSNPAIIQYALKKIMGKELI